jgi:NACHT domain
LTNVKQSVDKAEQDRLLAKLASAEGATFSSRLREHEPRCLPDTRTELLQQLLQWAELKDATQIFWLKGMAGTGKSTIARTLAVTFDQMKSLGGSFFFSRGVRDLGDTAKFFTTLTLQLVHFLPHLKNFVCSAISEDPQINQKSLSDQWTKLVLRPLTQLDSSINKPQNLVIMVDALDECDGDNDIRLILGLLVQAEKLQKIKLRTILTSRPELPVRLGFQALPNITYKDLALQDVPRPVVQHDISVFLRHELKKIGEDSKLPIGWFTAQDILDLTEKADRLFIYASTACRFVGDPKWVPEERLQMLLQQTKNTSMSPERELDEMYTTILKHSVIGQCNGQERDMVCKRFIQIVGSIVTIFDTLSASSLGQLLSVDSRIIDVTLASLHSVLDIPEGRHDIIRLLHPSFRDFLLDEQRCKERLFWIHDRTRHRDLADCCLTAMSNGSLRQDICDLKKPGALNSQFNKEKLDSHLPTHVQYACQYWVRHLQQLDENELEHVGLCDGGTVHTFLQGNILYWFEALSLMGRIAEGILMLQALQSLITVSCTQNTK